MCTWICAYMNEMSHERGFSFLLSWDYCRELTCSIDVEHETLGVIKQL